MGAHIVVDRTAAIRSSVEEVRAETAADARRISSEGQQESTDHWAQPTHLLKFWKIGIPGASALSTALVAFALYSMLSRATNRIDQ